MSIINVNGIDTEYLQIGKAGPNVVFITGFRIPMSSWGKCLTDVSISSRVFAYNRPGVGKSGKATCAQTGDEVVTTLRAILKQLKILPPYHLVAHSLGGLFAILFARLFPQQIASVTFVESVHPDEKTQQSKFRPPLPVHALNNAIKRIECIFNKYKYSEDEQIDTTIQQIHAAQGFPSIPVAVVTGTKRLPFMPRESFEIHLHFQYKLLELSPKSKHYISDTSGHLLHITDPELVVKAIAENIGVNSDSLQISR